MKRLMVRTAFLAFLLAPKCYAQLGGVIPNSDAAHASETSCVILKHMGRVDQVTSHLYSFGMRGKQFRYIEGKLPEGFPIHGRLTDHDVDDLKARGAEVIVLESHYTSEDLTKARADCLAGPGKTLPQAELHAPAVQAPGAIDHTPTPAPKADDPPSSIDTTEAALIDASSTPSGADVYIDGSFLGRTPSTLVLKPGKHEIAIKKSGFIVWEKKFNLPSGRINVDAELVPKAK